MTPIPLYWNDQHHLHAGRQEMFRGRLVDCHEKPDRLEMVRTEWLRRALGPVRLPDTDDAAVTAMLERVHTREYLAFLAGAWTEWQQLQGGVDPGDALPSVWPLAQPHAFRTDRAPANFAARLGQYAFDSGTPLMAGSWAAARRGAACAHAAAEAVMQGAPAALALTRPPGHHAGPAYMGGYCFLNNAAVAAETLRAGGHERVAVLDVDYHHGNGTQTIFYTRADVLTVSIHGDPTTEYPFYLGHADEPGAGAGEGCNLNLPLPRGSGFPQWQAALDTALARIAAFRPGAVVIPLGLDTFAGDPISGFRLQTADYARVGGALASLGLPTVFTFEGGYAVEALGVNAAEVMEGFAQAHRIG